MPKGASKLDISIKRRIGNIKSRKGSPEKNEQLNKTSHDSILNPSEILELEVDKKYIFLKIFY